MFLMMVFTNIYQVPLKELPYAASRGGKMDGWVRLGGRSKRAQSKQVVFNTGQNGLK